MAINVSFPQSSENWTDSVNQERTFETFTIIGVFFCCLGCFFGSELFVLFWCFFKTCIPCHQVLFHIDVRVRKSKL